ncbi:unnamed protein product [Schistosoma mattheei]|uniref:Flocculation protein FLO11-like n=1 Tax=Schistosoma mattheei TaxID=31246 RepID=A0AA85BQF4_9TREM|nr:unnamed protein product [Schistosoma mattheei]
MFYYTFSCLYISIIIFNMTFSLPLKNVIDDSNTTTNGYDYRVPGINNDDDSNWTVISHEALHEALNSTDDSLEHDEELTTTMSLSSSSSSPMTMTTETITSMSTLESAENVKNSQQSQSIMNNISVEKKELTKPTTSLVTIIPETTSLSSSFSTKPMVETTLNS